MDMVRKSDYKKAVDYGERYVSSIYYFEGFWRSLQKLFSWIIKIPPARTPELRSRQESRIVVPLLRYIGELFARDVERRSRSMKRYRPAYARVAEYLPLAIWFKWDRYRLASAVEVAPSVVRDALWWIRKIGGELPYGVL
ncbi:MAG: hypothetical protein DRJ03_16755 [Chloroflexi bacterium]|nr:MAG: hypothetical protein DRJ03_16755 [Chloroflexota bacterium]